jgi:hypothetical protein
MWSSRQIARRFSQGTIVENRRLGAALAFIQEQQIERAEVRSVKAPRRRDQHDSRLFKVGWVARSRPRGGRWSGAALRMGFAPTRRPNPATVTFLNGRDGDISIWRTHSGIAKENKHQLLTDGIVIEINDFDFEAIGTMTFLIWSS